MRARAEARLGTILFVHGSSMASQPTFDLQVPGRQDSSAMDHFARLGYDTWCVDMEGYGRSDKRRDDQRDIANGADDLAAATDYIARTRGVEAVPDVRHLLGRAPRGALRRAPSRARPPSGPRRLRVDGPGAAPPSRSARKRLPEYQAKNRRPIDRAFVRSIFTRDHPGTADDETIDAFADAILALDDSVPTGTYVDMCAKLPLVDPTRITSPTLLMRGQFDGIASVEDLLDFFTLLPNPDKQFAVMPGIAHASLQQKNYRIVHHILHSFFSQPAPVYRGA